MNRSSCKNKNQPKCLGFLHICTLYFLPSGETFVGMQFLAVRIFAIKGVLKTPGSIPRQNAQQQEKGLPIFRNQNLLAGIHQNLVLLTVVL